MCIDLDKIPSESFANDSSGKAQRKVMMASEKERQPSLKAVVVGGSIAGLACAHALLRAGWEVGVVEKSAGITGSPTGAGLGLDPLSCTIIRSWLGDPDSLDKATLPLTIDQSQAVDGEKKIIRTLTRDENFNYRAAHWATLHALLVTALPPQIFLWGHQFLSICNAVDKGSSVTVKAKVLQTGEIVEITGDLLVAADGSLSSIRQTFLPDLKLRYAGYCIWRGVLDFSENEDSDTILGIRKAYPDLGKCLYFDLAAGSHCVLYEILGKRMNWGWYVNQPEPETKGNSLTMKPSQEMIEKMHLEAEKVWVPELARLIRETEPFLNVIYDSDPLERIFWDNVVLVGDAAHPITPHSARSTNASILDAAVLGKCLEKHSGLEKLNAALSEYQSVRLPVIAKQVLHSRRTGLIRQGVALPDREPFDPKKGKWEDYPEFRQRNAPFFSHVPELLLDLS